MRRFDQPARHRDERARPRFDHLESRTLRASGDVAGLASLGDPPRSVAAERASGPFEGDSTLGSGEFGDGGWGDPPPTPPAPLEIFATDPAPGSVLGTPMRSVTVTFDRLIDPDSLTGNEDLLLFRVDDDGQRSRIEDATVMPGPERDRLVLSTGQALAPGLYEVLLWANTSLRGADGGMFLGDGTDRILADFRVEERGVGLADAIDLGTPGGTPTTTRGELHFRADPNQVRLYRITLPEGHFWRLGLEVTAQRDGGGLDSALAVFDAQGRPISVAEWGRSDAPKDPYLFVGLGPGTYYIGVSGTGNLPGIPAGYDPATATPGTIAQGQAGGVFALHLVADPVDRAVSLLNLAPDRADPLSSTVTGLTLAFSGAIRLEDPTGQLDGGIEVVDQEGRAWPVAALDYREDEARVTFLFRHRLPEGRYTVRLPLRGGLVDLAGYRPVATGFPEGVLGEFWQGPADDRGAGDLGPLFPDEGLAGVSPSFLIEPGDATTVRLVVSFPGVYTFQARYGGGSLAIRLDGPSGELPIDAGDPDAINGTNDLFLGPGVYEIRLKATGGRPVQGSLTIKSPSTGPESISLNGIGQGPGLSLRLIAPRPPVEHPPENPPPAPTPPGPDPNLEPGLPTQPPATPPHLTIPPPDAPAPTQPMPREGDHAAPPPRATARPSAKGPGLSTSGLTLGLGGDLVGRPVADDPLGLAFAPSVASRGIAPTYGDGGLVRRNGRKRASSRYGNPAEGQRPSAGEMGDAPVVGGESEQAPPGQARWISRPIAVVAPAGEPFEEAASRHETSDTAPAIPGEGPADPPRVAKARIHAAVDATLAVIVIDHAFRRFSRLMGRAGRRPRWPFPIKPPLEGG